MLEVASGHGCWRERVKTGGDGGEGVVGGG